MRQGTRRGRGESGVDRIDSGHSPNARSNSRHRGRPHRSVRRCAQRRRGRRAAGRLRGTRRWPQAPAPSPPGPGPGARHHLPAGEGVREGKVGAPGWIGGVGSAAHLTIQWLAAKRGRAGRTEQRSSDRAPQPAGGRAREWEPAKWTGRQRGVGQGCGARRRQ